MYISTYGFTTSLFSVDDLQAKSALWTKSLDNVEKSNQVGSPTSCGIAQ